MYIYTQFSHIGAFWSSNESENDMDDLSCPRQGESDNNTFDDSVAEPFEIHNQHVFKTNEMVFFAYCGCNVPVTDSHVQASLLKDARNPYLRYKPRQKIP